MQTLQEIDPLLVPAHSCTRPFKVSTINAGSADILQLIEPMNGAAGVKLTVATELGSGVGFSEVTGFVYWYSSIPPSLKHHRQWLFLQVANGFSRGKYYVLHSR